ncbi:MAG: hypothetical protein ACK5LS_14145 [Propioniciclava sp.]
MKGWFAAEFIPDHGAVAVITLSRRRHGRPDRVAAGTVDADAGAIQDAALPVA